MTRPEMISLVLGWDRAARERGDVETRRHLWRLLDALDWRGATVDAIAYLNGLKQTDAVVEIRAALDREGQEMKDELEKMRRTLDEMRDIIAGIASLEEGKDIDTYTKAGKDAVGAARRVAGMEAKR